MYTKVVHVLHKITQLPDITPNAFIVGTGNIMSFTPTRLFKCTHILIWFSKELVINSIAIGTIEQLVMPLSGIALAAPVTLKLIEDWFSVHLLPMMLREHNVCHLTLSTAEPTKPITIKLKGSFDVMALFGVELV